MQIQANFNAFYLYLLQFCALYNIKLCRCKSENDVINLTIIELAKAKSYVV